MQTTELLKYEFSGDFAFYWEIVRQCEKAFVDFELHSYLHFDKTFQFIFDVQYESKFNRLVELAKDQLYKDLVKEQ
jgi:hypothetical protein